MWSGAALPRDAYGTLFEDAFELLEHILRVLLVVVLLELKTSAACSTQGTNTVAVVPIGCSTHSTRTCAYVVLVVAPPTLKYYPSTVVLRAHIHSSVRHHDKLGTRT